MIPTDPTPAMIVRNNLIAGCLTMKNLLIGLRDSQGRVADEVHAIRKLGKSLRGGFSLFRLEKSAGRGIQSIGRLLSGSRDAVSRASTWSKIAWDGDPPTAAAILGLLEIQTAAARRRPAETTVAWCLARVNAAVAELEALPELKIERCLVNGSKRLKRQAVKRAHHLNHRQAADFHEARKALKAWLGAADYLPCDSSPVPPLYGELAELLGDENDIATLSRWLEKHGFTRKLEPKLWASLMQNRKKLQKKIIRRAGNRPHPKMPAFLETHPSECLPESES
jgi:hypothetical protein